MLIHKVFAYIIRDDLPSPRLLVAICHHEPGFEIPRGKLENNETPEQATLREIQEEAGIDGLSVISRLGVSHWEDERQYFLLLKAPPGLPETFAHTVVSNDVDNGRIYEYRWLPITPRLHVQLVQGCNLFVTSLLEHIASSV